MHAAVLILLIRSLALIAIAMGSSAWADDIAQPMLELPDEGDELDVDFASGNEDDRVSVSLADSELRVRLGRELRLHCEVSSRDDLDAPEFGIGLALRFKFQ